MNAFTIAFLIAMQPQQPIWLHMPTETVQQRRDREIIRKQWVSHQRMLKAQAESIARRQRINARQQIQPQAQRPRYYHYPTRRVNIQTPTGTVTYWVPY